MAYQIIQELCSGCHQCKVNCPVGAIRFKGVKYWIDPEMCIDCGECVTHCHNGIISKIGEPVQESTPHEPERLNVDLVVCGAGASGLVAAVKTAQAGKKVVVLEKALEAGGNSWYAGAHRFHYTRYHREKGLPDKRDDLLRSVMDATGWKLDVQLFHNVLQSSEALIDWLCDECDCAEDFGPVFDERGEFRIELQNKTVNMKQFKLPDRSIGPSGFGPFIVLKMLDMCRKVGVEVRTNHEAAHLKTDENGAVCGVIANNPGGIVDISAKAVILATGCFSRNEEYLRRANPSIFTPGEPIHYFSVPTCTGDGIRMADEIGAQIDFENTRARNCGPAHHPFCYSALCVCRVPYVVNINMNGKRWASEQGRAESIFIKQPGLIQYSVCDKSIIDRSIKELLEMGYDGEQGAAIFANYEQDIEEETKLDTPAKKADTLEELAELMGVPVEPFVNEIRHYNDMCRNGHDDDFFKEPRYLVPIENPPYYAFFGKRFQENAMGGVVIDSNTAVVRDDGSVIPGLYAIGDNCRGILVGLGPESDVVEGAVSSLTWSVTSGFLASKAVLDDLG